jgi:hypothetical protein
VFVLQLYIHFNVLSLAFCSVLFGGSRKDGTRKEKKAQVLLALKRRSLVIIGLGLGGKTFIGLFVFRAGGRAFEMGVESICSILLKNIEPRCRTRELNEKYTTLFCAL